MTRVNKQHTKIGGSPFEVTLSVVDLNPLYSNDQYVYTSHRIMLHFHLYVHIKYEDILLA